MQTERLFLAVGLSSSARKGLAERLLAASERQEKVRWVPLENVHITLRFFGEVSADQKAAITHTMERVVSKVQPFSVSISGVRIVRRRRRPQMVWATVEDCDNQLRRLHGRMERLLEQSCFAREGRPFSPHLTLARVRDGIAPWEQKALEEWAEAQRGFKAIPLPVEEVVLMKSELRPHGAEYTVCERFELQQQ